MQISTEHRKMPRYPTTQRILKDKIVQRIWLQRKLVESYIYKYPKKYRNIIIVIVAFALANDSRDVDLATQSWKNAFEHPECAIYCREGCDSGTCVVFFLLGICFCFVSQPDMPKAITRPSWGSAGPRELAFHTSGSCFDPAATVASAVALASDAL